MPVRVIAKTNFRIVEVARLLRLTEALSGARVCEPQSVAHVH